MKGVLMNKFVKGYFIGKSIEIGVAVAALTVKHFTSGLPKYIDKEEFIEQSRKKSQRKRLSR